MQFNIEPSIAPFVASQFPAFYQTEGPNFILFVQAYYEWMSQQAGPQYNAKDDAVSTNILYASRKLFDYRDIDNTLETFLVHFQEKYLYGIPFNVIINKRFLLKHILDVYRSKGTIQCYRLLFKLIYNEDIEVYLPGNDMFRPSDGTWVRPLYLEVTNTVTNATLVGKTIVGLSSNTSAVVESYIQEPFNQNIISSLYLTNILPLGATFVEGEKIIDHDLLSDDHFGDVIERSPSVIGSLDSLTIVNGGVDFQIGDTIGIVHRNITNNAVVSYGVNGTCRVDSLTDGRGAISFDIANPGQGITQSPTVLIYNDPADVSGHGAAFDVGAISSTEFITYNSDLLAGYVNVQTGATAYGFPGLGSANQSFGNIGTSLTYVTELFGSLASLDNIRTGNNYTQQLSITVRSVLTSRPMSGNVTYTTSNNNITGVGTNFQSFFTSNDYIYLQANTLGQSGEYALITNVNSDTSITLKGPPKFNSTNTATYAIAPSILPANFAVYESQLYSPDGTVGGLNTTVTGYPSVGKGIVGSASAINSGKGYVDGELVQCYLYGGISTPIVDAPGTGYANGDVLIFSDASSSAVAKGFITTRPDGHIDYATLTYNGSGYTKAPRITIDTRNGVGGVLSCELTTYNTHAQVLARVNKAGVGRRPGYWTSTRSFLSSDKYLQDSDFYQDFSYQIRVAKQLSDYREIMYQTFHPAGSKMFGAFLYLEELKAFVGVQGETSVIQP